MKIVMFAVVAAVISQTGTATAQSGDMKGMNMQPAPAEKKAAATAHKASGIVKKIDAAKGSVTVAHGPVPDLKWPAMTMAFTVKDKALMEKLVVNKKVDFEFVEAGKHYVVTAVK
jgi:Cu/Ag efflux protein CusF